MIDDSVKECDVVEVEWRKEMRRVSLSWDGWCYVGDYKLK